MNIKTRYSVELYLSWYKIFSFWWLHKSKCIFQAGSNDLCQLHYTAEEKLCKYYFSWWVKISSISSVRWIHSAGSDNPLEDCWGKLAGGQEVVEHSAYRPHPIINWHLIKTGLASCYLQRPCRLGWAVCLVCWRETGIKDLAVPISSLVRQVSVCWFMLLPFVTKFVTLEPPIFTAVL